MNVTRIWHEHIREDSEGRETVLHVHVEVTPASPARGLNPPEGIMIDILDIRDEAGNEAELTDDEVEEIQFGEASIDVLDAARDAYEGALGDLDDWRREERDF